jgi:chromosome segregation ATPase
MIGVNFGAVLGLVGWPMLQALKVVNEPGSEVVQRNQGDSISRLDASVNSLNTVVADLHARVTSAGERQEDDRRRLAEIDAAFGALRTSVHDMRAVQDSVAELTANATKARSDIVQLRTSLEELSRQRQPKPVAIRARIDQIEQAMVEHELLGTIRGSIQAPGERPRALAPRESASQADGHIFNLTPAQ